MFAIASDLRAELQQLLATVSPHRIVVVEEAPDYPGELVFQVFEGETAFYSCYHQWISRYLVLNELFNLPAFVEQLRQDGWEVVFGPSCGPILADLERWREPLEIEGYRLHSFQQYGLRRAFEGDAWFFNWSAGAGKSFCSAAGAKELFSRGEIDLVLAFTLTPLKINLCRFFEGAGLRAVVNDGTKQKRRECYNNSALGDHWCPVTQIRCVAEGIQVFVLNYEKSWVDFTELQEITRDHRVLFVLDEVAKIVTDNRQNKSRAAIEKLIRGSEAKVWPMSASVVNGNPLRYRDVFSIGKNRNPLGTKTQFEQRYANEVKHIDVQTKSGRTFPLTVYDWNLGRLQEIRHRVGDRTQAVRKTDPGVRETFKGLQTIVLSVQMTPQQEQLGELVIKDAWEARKRDETLMPHYRLLRYIANNPEALLHTDDDLGKKIAEEWSDLCQSRHAAKIEMLNDQLEEIREAGDKAVVFTHWTTLNLLLLAPRLTVPHVVHYGVGQSPRDSQAAIDDFKADPDLTCFLSSDAGSHGLSFQEARYVIQYEPTYSYDDGMQRASRIDRADSHLDGLTNFVYVTEASVEERVWRIQNDRRIISSAVQGTQEPLSYGDMERAQRSEGDNLDFLIFGDRM